MYSFILILFHFILFDLLSMTIYILSKLTTLVQSDPKAPFSIAATPRCRGGRYSIPWIAPFYPWSIPYNAES